MNPVIQTNTLSRQFGDLTAVDALELTVEQGEIFGFLGHNGAGKTTTVRLLNGVLQPSGGGASVLGFDPATDGAALRRRTGVLTETPSLDDRLTAYANLAMTARIYGVPEAQVHQRVLAMLERFELADRAEERVGGYSKGMKQRLALARAFLHQPDLIFLDEPTSSLDPISTRQVHDMIRHASQDEGRTVFLCTHNLVEAQRLCHRVGVMEHGRLVAVGTAAELAGQIGAKLRYDITVEADQTTAAQQIARRMHGVQQAADGAAGIVVTVNERDAIPDVLAALTAAGVRIFSVVPQENSLEDIYMALHQEGTSI